MCAGVHAPADGSRSQQAPLRSGSPPELSQRNRQSFPSAFSHHFSRIFLAIRACSPHIPAANQNDIPEHPRPPSPLPYVTERNAPIAIPSPQLCPLGCPFCRIML